MKLSADLMKVNFAALDVLCRLYDIRSFTKVAEQVGTSQSAISYTIDRLRDAFDDPLFIKEAGQQVPTARCDTIATEARQIIESYRSLTAVDDFDAASLQANFTIACNYYERLLIIPAIVRQFREAAPGIRLEIVNSSDDGHQRLLDFDADVLIGPFRRRESGFFFRSIWEERYVCLSKAGHWKNPDTLVLEEYLAAEHIMITYGGSWKSQYIQDIEKANHALQVALRVPSPAGVAQLVEETGLVATVPERLARRIGEGLTIVDLPMETRFQIGLAWTARTHHSPLHIWARKMILDAIENAGS